MQLLSTHTELFFVYAYDPYVTNYHMQIISTDSYLMLDHYLSTIILQLQLFCMYSLCASVAHVAEVVTVQFVMGLKLP